MITAIDSNVLLDFFGPDPTFGEPSKRALGEVRAQGSLVACDVVWAEVAAFFPSRARSRSAFEELGVAFSPVDAEAALTAADAWRSYRRSGGRRDRLVADFLIGAHALHHAERLLTRDRGFYRSHFGRLQILDPSR